MSCSPVTEGVNCTTAWGLNRGLVVTARGKVGDGRHSCCHTTQLESVNTPEKKI